MYQVFGFYPKGEAGEKWPGTVSFDFNNMKEEDTRKMVKQVNAGAKLFNYLKFEVWPSVFRQVNREGYLRMMYKHKPKFATFSVKDVYSRPKRDVEFLVGIEEFSKPYRGVNGETCVDIVISEVQVLFNKEPVLSFEPPVHAGIWSFFA